MQKFFKYNTFFGAIAILMALHLHANAQEKQAPYAFSLQQAIEYANQNQANVLNAAIDQEIAQKKVNELTGVGLPQISGEFDIKKFVKIPTTFIPAEFFGGDPGTFAPVQFGQSYSATAGVSASQLVFDGSYLVGLQAAKTYAELSRKSLQQSKIETAAQVSKAYYTVLVNREYLALLNANVERIKKARDDTKAMFDNGFVEKIDYDRLEVTYNNVLVEKQKTENSIKITEALLKFQMGMNANTELTLTDKLEDIVFDEAITMQDGVNYESRIEYSILQTNRHLQELDLKKNRFQYLPSLVAYGTFSYNASRDKFDIFDSDKRWYPTAIIGATLSVPIFDGLQKNARIQQSKLTLKKIDNGFKSLEQAIAVELTTAKTSLQNSISTLQFQKKNRELADEVAHVSKIKYDQGVGSNLEVVTAETSLKEAQTNYYGALFDALVAKVNYLKATGTLIKN